MLGDSGVLTVIANAGEAHRQGVKVYNLEVEQAHTYFVLAEHAPGGADAVWVHNARSDEYANARARFGDGPSGGAIESVKGHARDRVVRDTRLLEIAEDPNTPRHIKGWIRNELRRMAGNRQDYIRLPGTSAERKLNGRAFGGDSGYQLAHRRGFEARDGYTHLHSDLQLVDNHKLQHRIEGYK